MRVLCLSCVPVLVLSSALAPAAAQDVAGQRVPYPAAYFAPFHPNTAYDMILRVPGFIYSPGDPTQRGLTEAAGNVVVDGRRLADKDFTLDQVLQHIPADQVVRIEVLRGSSTGLDMLGQPVVANVIRRDGRGSFGAITIGNGVYADGRITPSATIEATRALPGGRSLSATASISRYVEVDKGDGGRTRTDAAGTVIERAKVKAKAGGTTGYAQTALETPAAGGHLRLDASFTRTSYSDRQRDTTSGSPPVTSIYEERLDGPAGGKASAEAGVHYSRNLGPRTTSETTLLLRRGWQDYSSLLASPGSVLAFAETDRTQEEIVRTKIHYQAKKKVALDLSLEAAANRLATSSAVTFNLSTVPLPDAVAIVKERRIDGGVDIVWNLSSSFELTAGMHAEKSLVTVRSDQGEEEDFTFLKPVLRLSFVPAKRQQIRLRVEREARQLAFTDFIASASLDKGSLSATSSRIAPQRDWIAEFAYELATRSGAALTVTLDHLWLNDVVDWVPLSDDAGDAASVDTRGNIGGGSERKVVVTGTAPLGGLGIHRATATLSATYDHARVIDPVNHLSRQISGLKAFVLSASVQQDLPKQHLTWGMSVDGPWQTTTYRFNTVDHERANTEIDMFADYHPRANLSVRLDVKDIGRRGYGRTIDTYSGLRIPGRFLYADNRRLRSGPSASLSVRKQF